MLFYSNVIMETSQQINRTKFFCRASHSQRVRAGIVFLGAAALFGLLWLAAMDKINLDQWLTPCGFKQKYDLPCPTCGITTSALAFAQGEIFDSFYIQPAGALLCSVLGISGFLGFLIAVFGVYSGFIEIFFTRVKIKYIILLLLIIIAGGWAVTLVRALAANN